MLPCIKTGSHYSPNHFLLVKILTTILNLIPLAHGVLCGHYRHLPNKQQEDVHKSVGIKEKSQNEERNRNKLAEIHKKEHYVNYLFP